MAEPTMYDDLAAIDAKDRAEPKEEKKVEAKTDVIEEVKEDVVEEPEVVIPEVPLTEEEAALLAKFKDA